MRNILLKKDDNVKNNLTVTSPAFENEAVIPIQYTGRRSRPFIGPIAINLMYMRLIACWTCQAAPERGMC